MLGLAWERVLPEAALGAVTDTLVPVAGFNALQVIQTLTTGRHAELAFE
jgi:hypothetical protein